MNHNGGRVRGSGLVGALAAAACCLALAACSQAAAEPTEAAPVPAGLERFYAQQLAWGPCTSFAKTAGQRKSFAGSDVQCALLEVPLDYAAPTGRTASIAVLRRTTDMKNRIGSIVLNPGGPGGSGMSMAANLAGLATGPFDVVGFDPRGVGASTPAFECVTDAEMDADRAEPPLDGTHVAEIEADNSQDAQQCVARSGGADVLANAGTRDVARDMDVLRAALGDAKLTYLGFSYGTRIGTAYAEQFPRNVRAMVLDGAIDPTAAPGEEDVAQAAAFQKAFETYAGDCAKTPTCPLGTDPAKATAAYQALTRPLLTKPAPAGKRVLSYSDATTGTFAQLYNPAGWPRLTAALTALAGNDALPLMDLADAYLERAEDGSYDNSQESLFVVNCLDGQHIADPVKAADVASRALDAAPFMDPGLPRGAARDTCSFLPVTPTGGPHQPEVNGLPPVLVVSTTGDPATPYQAGVNLAKALNGRLLSAEGTQHGAFLSESGCVNDAVVVYLATLELPADGTRCKL